MTKIRKLHGRRWWQFWVPKIRWAQAPKRKRWFR